MSSVRTCVHAVQILRYSLPPLPTEEEEMERARNAIEVDRGA